MTTAELPKSAQHTIECAECHQPYTTKRNNTRICNVCRLYTDVVYTHGHRRKCEVCDTPFQPLRRGDSICAEHTYQPRTPGEAQCVYCGNTRLRVTAGVDVCHWCARDPEQRTKFRRGLYAKVNRRRQDAVAS